MTTLISAYNSDGCIGRCDSKCHDATGGDCNCICGGANHGVGAQKAIENATEQWETWIEQFRNQHAEKLDFEVNFNALFQMPLFPVGMIEG